MRARQRYFASASRRRGDFLLVAVADREQHVLREVQVAALLAVVLEDVRLDDRIDRAALLAEAAEDALGQVDVVARRAARAVVAHVAISIVIASAGQTASHSLQAMQRSSPFS